MQLCRLALFVLFFGGPPFISQTCGAQLDDVKTGRHQPHILLIVTDQFRSDSWSPVITPNLYNLSTATGSTSFTNAYASTPTCTPSRAALLTGKSPWAHGMLGYSQDVNCQKYPTTMPEVLNSVGYESFVVGKDHFGVDPSSGDFITQGYKNFQLYDGEYTQPC